MPANIAKVQLSDTFNQWITQSNTTIDEVNTLLNGNFEKSGGTFTANGDVTVTTNGSVLLSKTTGTTLTNAGNTLLQKNLYLGSIANVESTLQSARNTATVSANSGSVRIANTINFIQSPNVAVSITQGENSSVANVEFTAINVVTSVGTGLGLTGGTITSTGTISANAASTTQVGVVQLNDTVTSTSTTVAGTANAVKTAYDKAATACTKADTAQTLATAANNLATAANTLATAGNTLATSANTLATSANTLATTANNTATLAYARANQAFGNVTNRTTTNGVAYYSATNNVASASGVTYDSNHGGGLKFSGVTYDTPIASISASTSYADNAAGKVILAGSASDITVTFDTATSSGFAVTVVRTGTGNVIIANTTGVAKVNSTFFITSNISAQYEAATVVYTATNQILVLGSIR